MSIHVVELECLVWMKEQATHHLTAESPGGAHIDCTNPSCSDGGFSVGDMLREAVKNKEEKSRNALPARDLKLQEGAVSTRSPSVVQSSIRFKYTAARC